MSDLEECATEFRLGGEQGKTSGGRDAVREEEEESDTAR
jgi:hypothetical protein